VQRSLEAEVDPGDAGGAGAFLQAQLGVSGPFRYVGYGSVDGDRTDYAGRRFETAVQAILTNGRPIFLGLYDIQGYNPSQLARYTEFLNAVNGRQQDYHFADLLGSGTASPLLALLGVRYVLIDASLPQDRADVHALIAGRGEVFRTDSVIVYETIFAPPHAWIVHDVMPTTVEDALQFLTSGAFDPARTALIESDQTVVTAPSDSTDESVQILRYEPDELILEARVAAPGLLVMREVYADGWRAFIDGREVDVLPTDAVLRGVPISAGTHVIEIRYAPASLRWGLLISGITAAGMLVAIAARGSLWVLDRRRSLLVRRS
jgi:hypothetical protein